MELILGDYPIDEIRLVARILKQKPPLIKRKLAEDLGMELTRVKKLLKKVKRDWRFSVQVNYHAIGLRRMVFVLKRKPDYIEKKYLSLYATTIEGNLIISYYLPLVFNPSDLIKKYFNDLKYYIILEGEYKPKPNLLNYYSAGRITVNLYEEIEREFKENAGKEDLEVNSFIHRFNEADLRIIMELQKDPLRSMRAIAEALGYTVPRVSGHLRFLTKNNIIESFSLKALPGAHRYLGRLVFATIIIGILPPKYPLRRLARSLSRIPLIGTILYGNTLIEKHRQQVTEYNEKIIYIPILTYEKTVDYVHEIVDLIKEYIEIYDVIIAMRKQKYTLPYKKEEYSKYKGFWNI